MGLATQTTRTTSHTMLSSLVNRLRQKGLGGDIARAAVGSLGIKVGQILLALGTSILLARVLGPESFGIYSYAFTLLLVISLPIHGGIATLVTREIAAGQQREQWGLVRGLMRSALLLTFTYSLLAALVGIIVLLVLHDNLGDAAIKTAIATLILMPVLAFVRLNAGFLGGFRHVLAAQLPDQIIRQLLFFLMVIVCTWFMGDSISPQIAMILHGASAFIALALGLIWFSHIRPLDVRKAVPLYKLKDWLGTLLPLTMIGGMQMINNQFDILMLGPMAGSENVGFYRVAVQGATLVAFALTAVNMAIGPHIARLYAACDHPRLQRMLTLSARVILLVATPIAVTFILFGEPILGWFFGNAYSAAGGALAILCAGQLLNAGAGSAGLLLNMTGHERDTAIGMAIAAVLNIALNLLLIPTYGIEGAAIATALSTTVWNIVLVMRVRARTGLRCTAISFGYKNR